MEAQKIETGEWVVVAESGSLVAGDVVEGMVVDCQGLETWKDGETKFIGMDAIYEPKTADIQNHPAVQKEMSYYFLNAA